MNASADESRSGGVVCGGMTALEHRCPPVLIIWVAAVFLSVGELPVFWRGIASQTAAELRASLSPDSGCTNRIYEVYKNNTCCQKCSSESPNIIKK